MAQINNEPRQVTNPGGATLSSANFVVNCPVLGFADEPPTAPQVPNPMANPTMPGPPNTGSGGDAAARVAGGPLWTLAALSLATVLGAGLALARRRSGPRPHRAR